MEKICEYSKKPLCEGCSGAVYVCSKTKNRLCNKPVECKISCWHTEHISAARMNPNGRIAGPICRKQLAVLKYVDGRRCLR